MGATVEELFGIEYVNFDYYIETGRLMLSMAKRFERLVDMQRLIDYRKEKLEEEKIVPRMTEYAIINKKRDDVISRLEKQISEWSTEILGDGGINLELLERLKKAIEKIELLVNKNPELKTEDWPVNYRNLD